MAKTTKAGPKRAAAKKPARSRAAPKTVKRNGSSGKVGPKRVANNAPGLFITLEGGEGTGKSSQMRRLGEKLKNAGQSVLTSREPGGSPGAEAVRHVLLSGAAEPFGAEMEAILFSAARGDHVATVIRPALEQGKIVISDRFFDSTRVYQGVSGKVDDAFVRYLEEIACGETWPDLTIIIDLDPEEGMRRAGNRRSAGEDADRFEKESLELQQMRREGYLKIASEEPQRCVVVDGSGTEDEVFERIWKLVEAHLSTMGNKPGIQRPKRVAHGKLTAKKPAKTSEKQGANR